MSVDYRHLLESHQSLRSLRKTVTPLTSTAVEPFNVSPARRETILSRNQWRPVLSDIRTPQKGCQIAGTDNAQDGIEDMPDEETLYSRRYQGQRESRNRTKFVADTIQSYRKQLSEHISLPGTLETIRRNVESNFRLLNPVEITIPIEEDASRMATNISHGFQPEKLAEVLIRKGCVPCMTQMPSSPKRKSAANSPRFRSPRRQQKSDSQTHIALLPAFTPANAFAPSLVEIVHFFPSSTILHFVQPDTGSCFSDVLTRSMKMTSSSLLRLYDVIPIKNCPGSNFSPEDLLNQGHSVKAFVPSNPWINTTATKRLTKAQIEGVSLFTHRVDRTQNAALRRLDGLERRQREAHRIAYDLLWSLQLNVERVEPSALSRLTTLCLRAIQQDNEITAGQITLDSPEADIYIRALSILVSKGVITCLKRCLVGMMSYTVGNSVAEKQGAGIDITLPPVKLRSNHLNRQPSDPQDPPLTEEAVLTSSAPNKGRNINSVVLDLTLASKNHRTFIQLVQATAIMCMVSPGIKDAFFNGSVLEDLALFCGRFLSSQKNSIFKYSSVLHTSLASLCRLNYLFGSLLLVYTSASLGVVTAELAIGDHLDVHGNSTSAPSVNSIIVSDADIRSATTPAKHGNQPDALFINPHGNTTQFCQSPGNAHPILDTPVVQCEPKNRASFYMGSTHASIHSFVTLCYLHCTAFYVSLLHSESCNRGALGVQSRIREILDGIVLNLGEFLQYYSSLTVSQHILLHGDGYSPPLASLFLANILISPNPYAELYKDGLAFLNLRFDNPEAFVNAALARAINEATRMHVLSVDDYNIIADCLIRTNEGLALVSRPIPEAGTSQEEPTTGSARIRMRPVTPEEAALRSHNASTIPADAVPLVHTGPDTGSMQSQQHIRYTYDFEVNDHNEKTMTGFTIPQAAPNTEDAVPEIVSVGNSNGSSTADSDKDEYVADQPSNESEHT